MAQKSSTVDTAQSKSAFCTSFMCAASKSLARPFGQQKKFTGSCSLSCNISLPAVISRWATSFGARVRMGCVQACPPIVTNWSASCCRRRSAVAPTALSLAAAAVRMKSLVCCFNCCPSLAPMYHGTLKPANNAAVSSGIMLPATQRVCTCEGAASADRVAACYLSSVAGNNIACCGVRCRVPLLALLNSVKYGAPLC